MASSYPFLYLNHGPLLLESLGTCDGAYIGFHDPVPQALHQRIIRSCPVPIRGFGAFCGRLFSIESPGDVYDQEILARYGTKEEQGAGRRGRASFGQETADRFAADVERWARGVHSMHPLLFFLGPSRAQGDDEWHRYSQANLTEVMLPFLERFVIEHPEIVAAAPIETRFDPGDVQPFSREHLACLLQEFDPVHGLKVPTAMAPRVNALIEKFPL